MRSCRQQSSTGFGLMRGHESIHALERLVSDSDDPASSSHWNHFHAEFSSEGQGSRLNGLRGFGSLTKRSAVRRAAHRVMLAPYRRFIPDRQDFSANLRLLREIAQRQDRTLDLDMYRQAVTLTHIAQRVPASRESDSFWAVIGDGFGVLAALILLRHSNSRVALFNLDRTLLVDLVFLRKVLGKEFDRTASLVRTGNELQSALSNSNDHMPRLIAVRAQDQRFLGDLPVDVVTNIASMQEMRSVDINGYFNEMRRVAAKRQVHFYCCNREEKELPDGSVIRFADYPWSADDEVLFDEACPWHQHYYSFGPPSYRRYDGPHRHRLIRVAP